MISGRLKAGEQSPLLFQTRVSCPKEASVICAALQKMKREALSLSRLEKILVTYNLRRASASSLPVTSATTNAMRTWSNWACAVGDLMVLAREMLRERCALVQCCLITSQEDFVEVNNFQKLSSARKDMRNVHMFGARTRGEMYRSPRNVATENIQLARMSVCVRLEYQVAERQPSERL